MRSPRRNVFTERISYGDGLALLWMDGLLLIPLMLAAFFYPLEALVAAGALLLVSFVIYEAVNFWKRHHVPNTRI